MSDFCDFAYSFIDYSAVTREQWAGTGRVMVYHLGIPDFDKVSDISRLVLIDDLLNEGYSRDVCELNNQGSD
jgi:hypothetical protein